MSLRIFLRWKPEITFTSFHLFSFFLIQELIHIWNGFTMFADHTKTLEHFLKLTEAAIKRLESQKGQRFFLYIFLENW